MYAELFDQLAEEIRSKLASASTADTGP